MPGLTKGDLVLVEKYVFLGKTRYRIAISGTNLVFNVEATSDEEAFNKVLDMAEKMGIDEKVIESLRNKVKSSEGSRRQ